MRLILHQSNQPSFTVVLAQAAPLLSLGKAQVVTLRWKVGSGPQGRGAVRRLRKQRDRAGAPQSCLPLQSMASCSPGPC